MERRQLEYFLAVVDHGSFTAAAKAVFVAQPSLSQAVRALERELGADLFHRLPHGVRLTSAGHALVASARRAIRDIATGRAAVQEVVGLTGGHLDLSMLPALAMEPIAPVVGAFRAQHPGVSFCIRQPEERHRVVDDVRTGRAEIGFVEQAERIDELESETLRRHELHAVLPPDSPHEESPATWQDLLKIGLIAGTPGTLVRDIVDAWGHQHGIPTRPAVEVGRRESGVYFVLAGAGAAAMPAPLARHAALLGAVVRPLADDISREVLMISRPGALSPAARTFRQTVREVLELE